MAIIAAAAIVLSVLALLYWKKSGFLEYVFLLRVQLLFLAAIVILPIVFRYTMENITIMDQPADVFWVVAGVLSALWISMPTAFAVLAHASERFGAIEIKDQRWFRALERWQVLIFGALGLPTIVVVFDRFIEEHSLLITIAAIAIGILAACFVLIVVTLVYSWLNPEVLVIAHRRFIGSRRVPQRIRDADPLGWLWRLPSVQTFLEWLGPGYMEETTRRLYPDHVLAAVAFGAFALWYVFIYLVTWSSLNALVMSIGSVSTLWPTLGYIIMLLILAELTFGALAFALDYLRFPLLIAVLLLSVLKWGVFETDHFFTVKRLQSPAQMVTPATAVEKWASANPDLVSRKPPLILVCASGGGIEAAAWTDKVLVELHKQLHPDFTRSIRLISSTSGGSVGAMFFVESLYRHPDAQLSGDELKGIWKAGSKSSLEAVGWGFAFPDFMRLFTPIPSWPKAVDRGWAMEQSWQVALAPGRSRPIKTMLSQWRERVNKGTLPATVFNATTVESGRPLLLSTVSLTSDGDSLMPGRSGENDHFDISVVTAARLSATFPYVSPVARGTFDDGSGEIEKPLGSNHVADGGYFDNFGVTAAVRWVRDFMEAPGNPSSSFSRIGIIWIKAFPKEPCRKKEPGIFSQMKSGWTDEIVGPAQCIVNARTTMQLANASSQLDLLRKAYGNFISVAEFTATQCGPLSWRLSTDEMGDIDSDWKNQQNAAATVGEWMNPAPASVKP